MITLPNQFPIIKLNDEYILREQANSDAKSFYDYYKNPNVNQYILYTAPKTAEDAVLDVKYWRELFYSKRGVYWGIARTSDDKMIGTIGLSSISRLHRKAEISYDLSEENWRKGIMGMAMEKVLDFGFNNIRLHRIEANTLGENDASNGILKKYGFVREGVLKESRFFNNKYHDVCLHALLKS